MGPHPIAAISAYDSSRNIQANDTALRDNKLHSFLTMFGSVWGIKSAIVLSGARHQLQQRSPRCHSTHIYKTANHQGDIIMHASPETMLVSFAILAVGVVSGLLPAVRAGRMDPVVVALRMNRELAFHALIACRISSS
jgi:hypothetical protein